MKYDRISGHVTERTRAQEAAPVLAEVSDVLASSLDSDTRCRIRRQRVGCFYDKNKPVQVIPFRVQTLYAVIASGTDRQIAYFLPRFEE
ncbi:MAG TPA: hypothetical protein VF932_07055 [Anaerolineae bacterium]